MNRVGVVELGDFFVSQVVTEEGDICGDGVWSVCLGLNEGEVRPFGVLCPKLKDVLGSFEGAFTCEVEEGFFLSGSLLVKEVF